MLLTTTRLLIRELRLSDLDQFDLLGNSDFVLQYLCMYKMNREQSLQYLQQMIERKKDFAIALQKSDKLIGKLHVDEDHLRFDVNSVDLAYWLGEPYTRQCYMTEALDAFIGYLFHTRQYDVITARVLAPTTASQALLKRLGFSQEGYLRKALRYNGVVYDDIPFSLLKEEFCAERPKLRTTETHIPNRQGESYGSV